MCSAALLAIVPLRNEETVSQGYTGAFSIKTKHREIYIMYRCPLRSRSPILQPEKHQFDQS